MEICFLKLQVMAPFPARKMYLVINLQPSIFLYEASAYPKKKLGCSGNALYTMPRCLVPDMKCSYNSAAMTGLVLTRVRFIALQEM
jgi:hypothetical protein